MAILLNFDFELLKFIHLSRIQALDPFFFWISKSAYYISMIFVVALLACFLLRKCNNITTGAFFKFYTLVIGSVGTGYVLKKLFMRTRPFVAHSEIMQMYESTTSSFPSGHTVTAFAIAFGVLYLKPKKPISILVFIWAVLIAYSRMALGSHYPTDVFSSIAIVIIFTILIKYLSIWVRMQINKSSIN